MQELNKAKLEEIVRAALELPPGVDIVRVGQHATPTWDSLAHAVLVGAIESEFGLQIDAAESLDLTSYETIAAFLESRGL